LIALETIRARLRPALDGKPESPRYPIESPSGKERPEVRREPFLPWRALCAAFESHLYRRNTSQGCPTSGSARADRGSSTIDGPEFLCREALRHARVSPKDARVPEALYRCIGAVHLGPASDRSNDLAKSAFRLLHRRYANSIWARENSFWYRGGGSPTSLAASFEGYTPFIAAIGAP
jgi:hypothetical protein